MNKGRGYYTKFCFFFANKLIWSQTVQIIKEHHPQYGLHALCGLFGYTRQAYYERLKYKQNRMLESDIILTLARAVRIDFPHMRANKLRIYLHPQFEAMGISIGRDDFAALLAENRILVHRPRSKRKTSFSHHRFHKYPNLIRSHTTSAPNRL